MPDKCVKLPISIIPIHNDYMQWLHFYLTYLFCCMPFGGDNCCTSVNLYINPLFSGFTRGGDALILIAFLNYRIAFLLLFMPMRYQRVAFLQLFSAPCCNNNQLNLNY